MRKTERYAATAGITTQAVLRAIARLPGGCEETDSEETVTQKERTLLPYMQ